MVMGTFHPTVAVSREMGPEEEEAWSKSWKHTGNGTGMQQPFCRGLTIWTRNLYNVNFIKSFFGNLTFECVSHMGKVFLNLSRFLSVYVELILSLYI